VPRCRGIARSKGKPKCVRRWTTLQDEMGCCNQYAKEKTYHWAKGTAAKRGRNAKEGKRTETAEGSAKRKSIGETGEG